MDKQNQNIRRLIVNDRYSAARIFGPSTVLALNLSQADLKALAEGKILAVDINNGRVLAVNVRG